MKPWFDSMYASQINEVIMEIIGWIGAVLLAFCGLPQAWKSIKDGNSDGITWSFMGMWLIGEILTLMYIWPEHQIPLITNYILNIVFSSIILWYKIPHKSI